LTVDRIRPKSGLAGSTSGGAKLTEAMGRRRPASASSARCASWVVGTSVRTMELPAAASSVNRVTTLRGVTCLASALITHFWRTIRS
jgi:uncharacterized protein (DUF2342 family)